MRTVCTNSSCVVRDLLGELRTMVNLAQPHQAYFEGADGCEVAEKIADDFGVA